MRCVISFSRRLALENDLKEVEARLPREAGNYSTVKVEIATSEEVALVKAEGDKKIAHK